ncbi:MAG: hypothetical protein ACTHKB_03335 [Burkholderiaceae bacterium]
MKFYYSISSVPSRSRAGAVPDIERQTADSVECRAISSSNRTAAAGVGEKPYVVKLRISDIVLHKKSLRTRT